MNRVKKELPKYKHAWPLLYFFIYLPWFLILEQKITPDYAGLHIIHCPLDDMIPFCEWFVIPYLIWFLYIPAVFLFLFYHSKKEFYRMCAYEFTGMTIALIVYTVFPNGLNLRLTDIGRPSIHVFATISAHLCLVKSKHMQKLNSRKRIKKVSWVLTVLICLSTVFLKQHSVIDLICGAILSIGLYFVVFKWWFGKVKFPAPNVKGPRKHEVLYFLNKKK